MDQTAPVTPNAFVAGMPTATATALATQNETKIDLGDSMALSAIDTPIAPLHKSEPRATAGIR